MKYTKYFIIVLLIVSLAVNCVLGYTYFNDKKTAYKNMISGVSYYSECYDKFADAYANYIRNPEKFENEYKIISQLTYDAMDIYWTSDSARKTLNKSYNIPAMMSYVINMLKLVNNESIDDNFNVLINIDKHINTINENIKNVLSSYEENYESNNISSEILEELDDNLFKETKQPIDSMIDELSNLKFGH